MKIKDIFFVSILVLSSSALGHHREHHIKVIGGTVTELTVEKLEKDFPLLIKIKTSLQQEPVQEFSGVLVSDLLAKYAESGATQVKVTATNSYEQILTEKDLNAWGALLAFKADSKVIATKSRGTFRIIYDYEKYKNNKEIQVILETNSVWQVIKIEFLKTSP